MPGIVLTAEPRISVLLSGHRKISIQLRIWKYPL